jgi:hypothetical protein
VFLGERRQAGHCLVAGVEDDGERALRALADQLALHGLSPALAERPSLRHVRS